MALADLIRMVNQIASNLVAFPEDKAAREAATHLRAYWTPAMREELLAYDAEGGALLSGDAMRAVVLLRKEAAH